MSEYYIGLMSGTSVDGIDAVLVDFGKEESSASLNEKKSSNSQYNVKSRIVDSISIDFDEELKQLLHSLCTGTDNEIEKAGVARVKLAEYEAKAVNELIKKAGIKKDDVVAVGCHGQTVRHRPEKGFSIQLDDGPRVAALTGIDVINNFRAADIANGGNGAPLTQAFHRIQFSSADKVSMVLNLGGIANLTVIDKDAEHSILDAFDTGPANTLIDSATRLLLKSLLIRMEKLQDLVKSSLLYLLNIYLNHIYSCHLQNQLVEKLLILSSSPKNYCLQHKISLLFLI